jgi:prolyl oligopeptidase
VPFERGGRWFALRNTGLQPQDVLFVGAGPYDPGQVLLDPNTLSEDGTIALTELAVSPDGRLLAYACSDGGSDWMTWRIRDIGTGDDLPDLLEWSKFSTAVWAPGATALFYAAYEAPATGRELLAESRVPRIMRHVLGTDPANDTLVFSAADHPDRVAHISATDDGRFLVVSVARGTFPENQLHVLDLHDPDARVRPLVADLDARAQVVDNVGTTFFLHTDRDAERGRIVAVDLDNAVPGGWREVVPEQGDPLLGAWLLGGRLVTHYLHDAHSLLRVLGIDGTWRGTIDLPGTCTLTEMSGHADSSLVLFATTSFTDPHSVWSHRLDTGRTKMLHRTDVPEAVAHLVTEQRFVTSADGTRLPVFLVHRRDVTPTGEQPVLLYGYGGFNIPLTPSFSAARAIWAARGGVLAIACLRGGGEFGRSWYDAGRLAHKQNVFDDFCAIARWLGGDSGWSRPARIAIHGGSNGGLLVGACLTQHPELFGAAAAAVGVFDMLRFHLFTIGWAWVSDYGDVTDQEAADRLLSYSPVHNVRAGASYPATLILTGDHDDRVAPGHSFKFAAALQAAQGGAAPILIRVDTSAGHGAGKPTQKLIDEGTDLLTFLEHTLEV